MSTSLRGQRALVTGAAGFLGSHLAERLLAEGAEVIGMDNLITGDVDNLAVCFGQPGFTFVEYDVTNYLHVSGPLDHVLHFASPASPVDYLELPIQTMKVGSLGTHKALGLAKAKGARFLLASTSEVYGDPQVHPQPEDYWGHVNPVGLRGCYDEAKRFAEALAFAYHRHHGVDIRIARIFNCYGPRMRLHDGRAVPNFIAQSLAGEPLTVHGDGSQTRSLQYVDDLVEGLLRLLVSDLVGPVNLGATDEVTILALARAVQEAAGVSPGLVHTERMVDDPEVRRPDASLAERALGWSTQVTLEDGLARTVSWFRAHA